MNRAHLTDALRSLTISRGYAFTTSPEASMPGLAASYPAAWLSPLKLNSVLGRRHGRITYSVKLHLLHQAMRLPPERRSELCDKAERDLLGIFSDLSLDARVALVNNLRIAVGEFSLTPHGELSATAEAEVVTIF